MSAIISSEGNPFKSLQWKIILIYSLLILFSLQLVSVYLVQSLERYYLINYKNGLDTQARLLAALAPPLEDSDDIAHLVKEFSGLNELEIVVLNRQAHVIASSVDQSLVGQRLIQDEITKALTGQIDNTIRYDPVHRERRYYYAFPVKDERTTMGVIYLSGSLRQVDATLHEIKVILLTGAAVALTISILLGIILTGTITAPIREVTTQAALMAKGDFSQKIKVRASDEIGQLGHTFNYLADRLSQNINEISSEKSKVEAIINNMSDGVIALDGRGHLIHINPAAVELLNTLQMQGPARGESGFHLLRELVGAEALRDFIRHKKPLTMELSREDPACTLQVKLAFFKVEHGRLDGTLMVLHDVTGERELARRQQEFVADVSHELRTPLATIKSYVDTLLDGASEDAAVRDRFLKVVEQETDRMVSLVKDLLALSQLDYSQVEWHKTEVELKSLAEEVVERSRQKALNSLPAISVSIPPGFSAYVDRDKIMQVFWNIINNAVKYTPPEGKIEISATPGQDMVKVVIADSGVGIPPEDLPRIFERFYRVEKMRSRDYGGTGLGLPIARKVVEAHGGSIWIESKPGEGTKVFFTLPRFPVKEDL